MNIWAIIFIVSGITIIIFPDIIAYILWGILLSSGILMLGAYFMNKSWSGKDYYEFGEYKIFKNKK